MSDCFVFYFNLIMSKEHEIGVPFGCISISLLLRWVLQEKRRKIVHFSDKKMEREMEELTSSVIIVFMSVHTKTNGKKREEKFRQIA